MECAEHGDYWVFDGQNQVSRAEYEAQRMPNMRNAIDVLSKTDSCDTELQQNEKANMKSVSENRVTDETQSCSSSCTDNVPVVYIDGSCKGNGTKNSKAGIGVYWGDNHPWNVSNTLSQDQNDALTNNKAELRATIRALEIACEHKLDQLIINSDSKYVVLGITEWIYKWQKNNWKTSSGEPVKNKEEWVKLFGILQKKKRQ